MVKVSIIVPIYNVMKYLHKCLDSLVNQTLTGIEIILVNDASPDDSNIIMEEYHKKYPKTVKCIYLEQNMSQGGARNIGIDVASGDYLMFVDSDDWIDLTMCEKLYTKAVQGDYDIVGCDYYQVKENTGEKSWNSFYFRQQTGKLDSGIRASLMFTYAFPFAKLIRRDLIVNNKLYFTPHMKYEDCALTPLYFIYAKDMELVEEPLYYYNIRENSTTQDTNIKKHMDVLKAAEILSHEFDTRGIIGFNEEIAALYIKLTHYLFKKSANHLDKLDRSTVNYLGDMIKTIYPKCLTNYYYYSITDAEGRQAVKCFINYINEGETDYVQDGMLENPGYINYYRFYKDKIIQLFEYCSNENLRIAIWGAGRKGNDFLLTFDEYRDRIPFIIDKNIDVQGSTTKTGQIIVNSQQVIRDVDLVIIMNKNYYSSNKQEMKAYNCEIKIFNLDLYLLMKDASIEEIIE